MQVYYVRIDIMVVIDKSGYAKVMGKDASKQVRYWSELMKDENNKPFDVGIYKAFIKDGQQQPAQLVSTALMLCDPKILNRLISKGQDDYAKGKGAGYSDILEDHNIRGIVSQIKQLQEQNPEIQNKFNEAQFLTAVEQTKAVMQNRIQTLSVKQS